ncbi:UDP-galactopyranose mutase [compost metagenome]
MLYNKQEFNNPIIFTGALDELLQYRFGYLPYRSLELKFEQHNKTWYQSAAVVNYPNEEDFTRITEFKYLSDQDIEGRTTILKEYPLPYQPNSEVGSIPYYPILNPENLNLFNKYKEEVELFKTIYPCGRLAEYKYFNMDAAIENALNLAYKIGERYA